VPASAVEGIAAAAAAAASGMVVHGVRTLAEALATADSVPAAAAGSKTAAGTMPGWSTVPAAANR
jgi:hypothetical protein